MTKKKVREEEKGEAVQSIWFCEDCHWNTYATMPKPDKCPDCNSEKIVERT